MNASPTRRLDVPMPPLKPCATMPVPPPTLPSATGAGRALFSAWNACALVTCWPRPSFRNASEVSPTTGWCHGISRFSTSANQLFTASRTTPTE